LIKEQDNSLIKELILERDSLQREVNKVLLKKSKQEIEFLKSQNTKLQKGLSEKTIEFIREKVREVLSSKNKELSDNQPSSKIPVFFSQPTQEEETETEYEEISDLDILLSKATEAVLASRKS